MKRPSLASLSSVSLLLLFILFPSGGRAQGAQEVQNYTLEYPCELALVLDDSGSIGDDDFQKVLLVVREIPAYFKMGANYSRVAVVVFSSSSSVRLNLMADETLMQTLNIPRQRGGTMTDLALKDVKEKVFVNTRLEALKIVILITDGEPYDPTQTEAVADELKKDGSLVYIAYVGLRTQEVRDHVNRVAGDPSQVFPIEDFNKLKNNLMLQIQKHVICRFDQICRFNDPKQQTCVEAWWRPRDHLVDLNCTYDLPSQFPHQCQMGECDATCEKWPWQSWICDESNAGQRLTISREGDTPPSQQISIFENCPREKKNRVPSCCYATDCDVRRVTNCDVRQVTDCGAGCVADCVSVLDRRQA